MARRRQFCVKGVDVDVYKGFSDSCIMVWHGVVVNGGIFYGVGYWLMYMKAKLVGNDL
jgi:formate/nitrite transporter FocA (FNT family)